MVGKGSNYATFNFNSHVPLQKLVTWNNTEKNFVNHFDTK